MQVYGSITTYPGQGAASRQPSSGVWDHTASMTSPGEIPRWFRISMIPMPMNIVKDTSYRPQTATLIVRSGS